MDRRAAACAIVALLAVLATPARAAGGPDLCGPRPDDRPARVAAVTDDVEVVLDDGRTLRLAGVDVPRASRSDRERAVAARHALEGWIGTGPVMVRNLADPDRWGRTSAVLLRPEAEPSSASLVLLAGGYARAAPEPALRPCFADLVRAEDEARAAQRGLWSDPAHAVLRADDRRGLAAQSGGLAIVEGTLDVHAGRGGILYLTLARDRFGFMAVLARRDAARFAAAGFDVNDYVGTPVRMRGDLDDRFGARLRLTDPEQFESLEPGALASEPATGDP